ncbi:hypothetical protein APHAL10511_007508 [Amanita phalloides]|nr:hypothetical protein APHAL10511_007508 [Amanita phalloides]
MEATAQVLLTRGPPSYDWKFQISRTGPRITGPGTTDLETSDLEITGPSRPTRDSDDEGDAIGAETRIVGEGGGVRVFWQANDASIYIKGWEPDGEPWPTKLLVPGERVRKPTPLAALCWGGESGFNQIRLYYVDKRSVLQEMQQPDGSSRRPGRIGMLRLRVSRQSRLLAKFIGGGLKVRFRSMRGARKCASETLSAEDW